MTDAGATLAKRFAMVQTIEEYQVALDAADKTPLSNSDEKALSAARQEARQRITRETHAALCKTLIQRFNRCASHENYFRVKCDLDAWMVALTLYAPPNELNAVKKTAADALDELDDAVFPAKRKEF